MRRQYQVAQNRSRPVPTSSSQSNASKQLRLLAAQQPPASATQPVPAADQAGRVLRIADNRITLRMSSRDQPPQEQSFVVLDDGEITLDGESTTLGDLAVKLQQMSESDGALWARVQAETAGDLKVAKVIKGFTQNGEAESDSTRRPSASNSSCQRVQSSCCSCLLCRRRLRILRPFCRISHAKEITQRIVEALPPLPELDELPSAEELSNWEAAPPVNDPTTDVTTLESQQTWQDLLWNAYCYLSQR